MAVYGVVGKLGTGKTKFAVFQATNALADGRIIAGNIDLKPWLMFPYKMRQYIRIPDKPTAADLEAIGHGNPDSYDESKNGILILDELGTWLNTRNFQDRGRSAVIDWLIHARKLGWDVYFIVQDEALIDKQVRDSLIEYQCRCINLSKIRIPIIGGFLSAIHTPWGYLPRAHSVTARVGYGQNAVVSQKWIYRGDEYHDFYDTRQIFRSDYPHGPHCVLPPWDWKPKPPPFQKIREFFQQPSLNPRTQPSPRKNQPVPADPPDWLLEIRNDPNLSPQEKIRKTREFLSPLKIPPRPRFGSPQI